ncbi:MAG: serine/threonine-protein kinase [Planctomycetota bacterium]|nr:serine/threonine-protein kinase [Planctomycetota bacterium]
MPDSDEKGSRYEFAGEIARGGMGAILVAYDRLLMRNVAIKLLLTKHSDNPRIVARFVAESQVAAQLQHPGVVPVYDTGTIGPRPFLAMKLVSGKTLGRVLDERSDPSDSREELLLHFEKVCEAVSFAHSRGVVHRDLKPGNIMIGPYGEVQVMDWGLAKILAPGRGTFEECRDHPASPGTDVGNTDSELSDRHAGHLGSTGDTAAGDVMGTPAYMPPEQWIGDAHLVTERADVFSLGAILCEIITGTPPFDRDHVTENGRREDLCAARQRIGESDIGNILRALCLACLDPVPHLRPKDAGELLQAVAQHRTSRQEDMRKMAIETQQLRVASQERRKRTRLLAVFAISLLALIAVVSVGWDMFSRRREQKVIEVESLLSSLEYDTAEAEHASLAELPTWIDRAQLSVRRIQELTPDANTPSHTQLKALTGRLEKVTRVASLIPAIEDVRNERDSSVRRKSTDGMYRRVFDAAGVDIDSGNFADAAASLAKTRESNDVIEALVEWALLRRQLVSGQIDSSWIRVLDLANALDHDPWRVKVRDTLRNGDSREISRQLGLIASDPEFREQAAITTVLAAKLLLEFGQGERARQLLVNAWVSHPDDYWTNHLLGNLSVASPGGGRTRDPESLRYLTVAVALRPSRWYSHFHLARRFQETGRTADAIVEYRRTLRLDNQRALVYSQMGNALRENRELAAANESIDTALKLDSECAVTHYYKALCLVEQGLRNESVNSFRRSLELDWVDARVHYQFGDALQVLKRYEEALIEFDQVMQLEPKNVAAQNKIAVVLYALNRVDEAWRANEATIKLDPKHQSAYLNRGVIELSWRDFNAALSSFDTAIALNDTKASAHLHRGEALQGLGRIEDAIAAIQLGLQLKPEPVHINRFEKMLQELRSGMVDQE